MKAIDIELSPLHGKISKALSVTDIKLFSEKITIHAKKHNIKGLTLYSKELISSVNQFNLDKIKKLLSDFNEIVSIIKN